MTTIQKLGFIRRYIRNHNCKMYGFLSESEINTVHTWFKHGAKAFKFGHDYTPLEMFYIAFWHNNYGDKDVSKKIYKYLVSINCDGAMICLAKIYENNYKNKKCIALLKKAVAMNNGIAMNNLACKYDNLGKISKAVKYYESAMLYGSACAYGNLELMYKKHKMWLDLFYLQFNEDKITFFVINTICNSGIPLDSKFISCFKSIKFDDLMYIDNSAKLFQQCLD